MIGEWQHWSVCAYQALFFALIILFATLPAILGYFGG